VPGVVDQDVDVSDLLGKPPDFSKVPQLAGRKRAFPPASSISLTVWAPRPVSRPCTITSKPSAANFMATARPIPDVAPVTSAFGGRMSVMSLLLQVE